MKRIIKIIGYIAKKFIKLKLYFMAEFFLELRILLLSKKKIKINFDGTDWIFKWDSTAAVSSHYLYDPKQNLENIDLFFFDYSPKKDDIIMNLGVENGSEIPFFCEKVGINGKVYAVEADPNCCRRLLKLKNILKLDNLIIIEKAIGSYEGEVYFSNDKNESTNKVLKENFQSSIKTQQTTLNNIFLKNSLKKINYVKSNIEGSEKSMLENFRTDIYIVENWCIGCHDFLGINNRTYDHVKSFLVKNKYVIKNYQPQDSRIWRNYYLYGKMI